MFPVYGLLTEVWLVGSVACVSRHTLPEMPPPSPASSEGSTGMVPSSDQKTWL